MWSWVVTFRTIHVIMLNTVGQYKPITKTCGSGYIHYYLLGMRRHDEWQRREHEVVRIRYNWIIISAPGGARSVMYNMTSILLFCWLGWAFLRVNAVSPQYSPSLLWEYFRIEAREVFHKHQRPPCTARLHRHHISRSWSRSRRRWQNMDFSARLRATRVCNTKFKIRPFSNEKNTVEKC